MTPQAARPTPAPGRAAHGQGVRVPYSQRSDASMSLLIDAARNPLDPGYEQAAARRAAKGRPDRRTPKRDVIVLLVAVALGAGTVWATRELRAPQPEILQARLLLEEQIQDRAATNQSLEETNAALSAEVDALSAEALDASGDAVLADIERLATAAGTSAVRGPGLVLTLSDSPRAAAGAPDAADERVQDLDLQILSNSLWASGAEAIAVNGQRLTALSAIRSAGQAILVDLVPLIGPYRVEAIGDPRAMPVAFARTAGSSHLVLLRDTYGIGTQMSAADDLVLPAGTVPVLHHADPLGPASPEPGDTGAGVDENAPVDTDPAADPDTDPDTAAARSRGEQDS